eukprot:Sspe_Gene.38947::Locus_18782_Transcript_1_1_Confidence_1.000_Length_1375::g.38947::m.38947
MSSFITEAPLRVYSCILDLLEGIVQVGNVLVDVLNLVQPEEPEAEGVEGLRLIDLQRHPSGDLDAQVLELDRKAALTVADHHARGTESFGSNTLVSMLGAQLTHLLSQFPLPSLRLVEPELPGLRHHVTEDAEGVGGHGAVVDVSTLLVGLHHVHPRLEAQHEACALCLIDGLATTLVHHHQPSARRPSPPLLRSRQVNINVELLHVNPDCPRGNAVEDEDTPHLVHRIGNGLDVVVGEDDASTGLNVRCADHRRLLLPDGRHHLVDGRGCEGRLTCGVHGASLHDCDVICDAPLLEDLRPPEAEKAVPDDKDFLPRSELPSNALHPVASRPGNDGHRVGVVHLFEERREVVHHRDEGRRHVVQHTVSVDH